MSVVAVAMVLVGCSQGPKDYQLYAGDALPANEVARVSENGLVQILAVDGEFVGTTEARQYTPFLSNEILYRPYFEKFDILPGRHRLEVRFDRTVPSEAWLTRWAGTNAWSLDADFKAGGKYTFELRGPDGKKLRGKEADEGGIPVLVRQIAGGEPHVVAEPMLEPAALPDSAFANGPVIRGLARSGKKTATGERIFIFPDSKEARRWAKLLEAGVDVTELRAPELDHETVIAYGLGHFDHQVGRPGQYLIVYPGAGGFSATYEEVFVPADARQVPAAVVKPVSMLATEPPEPPEGADAYRVAV